MEHIFQFIDVCLIKFASIGPFIERICRLRQCSHSSFAGSTVFTSFGRRGVTELLKDWSIKINCKSNLLSLPCVERHWVVDFCYYLISLTQSDPLSELLFLSFLYTLYTSSLLGLHPLFLGEIEIFFAIRIIIITE